MRYRVVEKDEFRVVGEKARVPLVHEGMNPAIVAFMRGIGEETRQRMEALSDQEPSGPLNVSVNIDESRAGGTELDYYHGVATGADVLEDMDSLTVPAGTWAVFEGSGLAASSAHRGLPPGPDPLSADRVKGWQKGYIPEMGPCSWRRWLSWWRIC